MDWIAVKNTIHPFIKKYAYIFLVLLLGIFLMTRTEGVSAPQEQNDEVKIAQKSLEQSLEEILSHLSGSGKVKVLLTELKGEEILYQLDETGNLEDQDKRTVIITNSSREEAGLRRQIINPEYRGAVIVCEGADDPKVRLSIVEAVKSVTGLTADRITVLKMK